MIAPSLGSRNGGSDIPAGGRLRHVSAAALTTPLALERGCSGEQVVETGDTTSNMVAIAQDPPSSVAMLPLDFEMVRQGLA